MQLFRKEEKLGEDNKTKQKEESKCFFLVDFIL